MERLAIEIVSFPMKNKVIFHTDVNVYQRVCHGNVMRKIWVNYNDRTLFSRTLESWLVREIIPKWPNNSG